MTEMTVTHYLTDAQLDTIQKLTEAYNDLASVPTTPEHLLGSMLHMSSAEIDDRMKCWSDEVERRRKSPHGTDTP